MRARYAHTGGVCVYKFVVCIHDHMHTHMPIYTVGGWGEVGGKAEAEKHSPLSLVGSVALLSFYLQF